MKYLNIFRSYFSDNPDENLRIFNSKLKEDLFQMKNNFLHSQIEFDFEPIDVKSYTEEKDDYIIYSYVGSFIYGFKKDKIFHLVPGDLSTQSKRQANEHGAIIFYFNKKTKQIDTISESFAGNYWGLDQDSNKLTRLFFRLYVRIFRIGISVLMLFTIVFLFTGLYNFKNTITYLIESQSVYSYNNQINLCARKNSLNYKDPQQYCAIQIAKEFYDSNPKKAITLCMVYTLDYKKLSISKPKIIFYKNEKEKIYRECQESIVKSISY